MSYKNLAISGAFALLSNAQATGLFFDDQDRHSAGSSGAGAAVSSSASGIYYNPAIMPFFSHNGHLSAGFTSAISQISFHDEGSVFPTYPKFGEDKKSLIKDFSSYVSGALFNYALALPLNNDVWVAIELNSPYAGRISYPDNWIGKFGAYKSQSISANANASVAYKIADHLSLGFGLNYQYLRTNVVSILNMSGITKEGILNSSLANVYGLTDANICNPLVNKLVSEYQKIICTEMASAESRILSGGLAPGYNLGIMYSNDTVKVGLSYRSKLDYKRMDGNLLVKALDHKSLVNSIISQSDKSGKFSIKNRAIFVNSTLPAWIDLSVNQKLTNSLNLLLDYRRFMWSSSQNIKIEDAGGVFAELPMDLADTNFLALGMEYILSDSMTMRMGISRDDGFYKKPVSDNPVLLSGNKEQISFGYTMKLSDSLKLEGFTSLAGFNSSVDNSKSGNEVIRGYTDIRGIFDVKMLKSGAQLEYKF